MCRYRAHFFLSAFNSLSSRHLELFLFIVMRLCNNRILYLRKSLTKTVICIL